MHFFLSMLLAGRAWCGCAVVLSTCMFREARINWCRSVLVSWCRWSRMSNKWIDQQFVMQTSNIWCVLSVTDVSFMHHLFQIQLPAALSNRNRIKTNALPCTMTIRCLGFPGKFWGCIKMIIRSINVAYSVLVFALCDCIPTDVIGMYFCRVHTRFDVKFSIRLPSIPFANLLRGRYWKCTFRRKWFFKKDYLLSSAEYDSLTTTFTISPHQRIAQEVISAIEFNMIEMRTKVRELLNEIDGGKNSSIFPTETFLISLRRRIHWYSRNIRSLRFSARRRLCEMWLDFYAEVGRRHTRKWHLDTFSCHTFVERKNHHSKGWQWCAAAGCSFGEWEKHWVGTTAANLRKDEY